MSTPSQTLAAVLEYLGLPKGASEEEVTKAIQAREAIAKASGRSSSSREAKWTPRVSETGAVHFAGSVNNLCSDELDAFRDVLNSDTFKEFCIANADKINPRTLEKQLYRDRRQARKDEAAKAKETAAE